MTQLDMLRLFREMHPDKESKTGMPFEEILHQAIVNNPGLNAPKLAELLHRSLRTTQRYLKVLTTDKRISFRGVAKKGGYFAEVPV
ncbi:MAG: hypothetical protein Q4F84_09180 [Fibrobacter sp.]|nr:hypothetical protein [Fibrobacter sp.]